MKFEYKLFILTGIVLTNSVYSMSNTEKIDPKIKDKLALLSQQYVKFEKELKKLKTEIKQQEQLNGFEETNANKANQNTISNKLPTSQQINPTHHLITPPMLMVGLSIAGLIALLGHPEKAKFVFLFVLAAAYAFH